MRRRLAQPEPLPVSSRLDTPKVKVIRLQQASRLVTLDDPESGPEEAQNAFCRIIPPEGLSEDKVASWRDSVAKVAKAVKVLPIPKVADVPAEAARVEEKEKVGTVREEALKLAEQTKKKLVIEQTKKILDEVGA